MRRIVNACIMQTTLFETKEEYAAFISVLDKRGATYKVDDVVENADGTVLAKLRKQYNDYSVGEYLD